MAVISSPTLTGSRYSKRFPPFSQPLPYSSASSRWAVTGASATRKVGGASVSQRGYESPIASANRFSRPASTNVVVGGLGVPIRARSLSTTDGVLLICSRAQIHVIRRLPKRADLILIWLQKSSADGAARCSQIRTLHVPSAGRRP